MFRIDPINFDDGDDEPLTFPCACGDPQCVGFNDDPFNIRLGTAWYAADCVMANRHPLVVEGRAREARRDEGRDAS